MGVAAVHVWELREQDGMTRVITRESFDGLLAGLFPGWMAKMLGRSLQQGLADLKRAAEAKPGIPPART